MSPVLVVVLLMFPGSVGQPGRHPPVRVIRATGVGYPPGRMSGAQARLMAKRAAEVRALRNLATKLGHGRHARVRGFRYLPARYRADGSVRVVVEKVVSAPRASPPRTCWGSFPKRHCLPRRRP